MRGSVSAPQSTATQGTGRQPPVGVPRAPLLWGQCRNWVLLSTHHKPSVLQPQRCLSLDSIYLSLPHHPSSSRKSSWPFSIPYNFTAQVSSLLHSKIGPPNKTWVHGDGARAL